MILRPQQIHLIRRGLPLALANMGGGGGTTQSQQTTNTTTSLKNDVTSVDSRSVASDHAIALGGANDSVTSTSNVVNNVQTSDFGSVQAALDGMQTTAGQAIGATGAVAYKALDNLRNQSAQTLGLMSEMFNFAKTSSANSQGTAAQALGMASAADNQLKIQASATNKGMKEIAIAGAAIVAAFLVFRKA